MNTKPKANGLAVIPMTRKESSTFIRKLHRHHKPSPGYLFAVGVASIETGEVVGVATIGRPVSRELQDGWTVEVTRTCSDATPNVNSCLYGAGWSMARAGGFHKALTYTQEGESGASLRAVGWVPVERLNPRLGWDTPSRPRNDDGYPTGVARIRWEIATPAGPPWKERPQVPAEGDLDAPIQADLFEDLAGVAC